MEHNLECHVLWALLKVVFFVPLYNNIISCCSPFHNFSLENFDRVLFGSDSDHNCSNSFLSLGPLK